VAVASNGRVWVGTECDGLAWSDPPYTHWQCVRAAAEMSGDKWEAPGLRGRRGPGLPSNLTNDLLVLGDGTVVYTTNYGLGIGSADGQSWTAWQGLSKEPYENYMRGLAVDKSGGLWIATRHKGLVRMDMKTGAVATFRAAGGKGGGLPDDYVFDVAVAPSGDVWAGTYGGGLAKLNQVQGSKFQVQGSPAGTPKGKDPGGLFSTPPAADKPSAPSSTSPSVAAQRAAKDGSAIRNPQSDVPLLPAPAAPPTLDELNAMLAALAKVPFVPPEKQPAVVRLDDDWLTKGDCLGRYGRYWGCWCAICSPNDYIWGAGPERVEYAPCIGLNCTDLDSLRRWIHWSKTNNVKSLEMPPTYLHSRVLRGETTWGEPRRQAEWDDHGETYPMAKDGPDLYCTLKVPPGLYYLALYNFNKDGHDGANRYRDFCVSVRPHATERYLNDISGFDREPELARGRMRDFWGGAYKRFLVRGPTEITIEVGRNHSFCTILAGVFLDLVDEEPVPYFHGLEEWKILCAKQEKDRQSLRAQTPADRAARFQPGQSEAEAALRLFAELERTRLINPVWWAREGRRFYAPVLRWTRSAVKNTPAGPEIQRLLARATTCYYQLGIFEKWEQGQVALGKTPARQIEKGIRWDGITECGGKGFEIVIRALSTTTKAKDASVLKEKP